MKNGRLLNKLLLTLVLGIFWGTTGNADVKETIDSLQEQVKEVGKGQSAEAYNELARLYYSSGNYSEALNYAQKALTIADTLQLYEQIAKAHNRLGFTYFKQQKYPESVRHHRKAVESARKGEAKKEILKAYNHLSVVFYYQQNYKQLRSYAEKTLKLARELENQSLEAEALQHLGMFYYQKGLYDKALDHWEKQLKIIRETGDKANLATSYNNIGVIYKNWGKYEKAIESFQKTLEIQKDLGDTLNMARSVSNIGNVYFNFGVDLDKARDYYERGFKLFKSIQDTSSMADILNNLGLVYQEEKAYKKASEYFKKAMKFAEKINDQSTIAKSQMNLGAIYLKDKNYELAKQYSFNAMETFRDIEDKKEIALSQRQIGRIYKRTGDYEEALNYYRKSIRLMKEMNLKKELLDTYKRVSQLYSERGNDDQALYYYKLYSHLKDSTLKENYLETIEEQRTKYQMEKKEERIKYLNERNKRQEAENRRQRVLIYSSLSGLVLILVFSLLLFKQYNDKRKANNQLEKRNEEISQQRDQIYRQKQEITDSIQYASRIQKAILPPEEILQENLPEHFILFKPRDIVSGDFYWFTQKGDKLYFTVADCTGHGVPGAFMSMLGIAFLNEIVNSYKDMNANEILEELRKYVVESLHQTGKTGETQDGMDISLCILDYNSLKLQYAGAYNPLILIRDGALSEKKGDKMPIGIHHEKNEAFSNYEIQVQKGDSLYLFSDGYPDQFGGEKGKKFLKKRFKQKLLDIHEKSMAQQHAILEGTIEDWKGGRPQIDDIIVMGVRV